MAAKTNQLKVTLPTDTTILLEREFDAPRHLVWDAMTKPEYVKQWWGPRGYTLPSCEIDLRVGGEWRYVSRAPGRVRVPLPRHVSRDHAGRAAVLHVDLRRRTLQRKRRDRDGRARRPRWPDIRENDDALAVEGNARRARRSDAGRRGADDGSAGRAAGNAGLITRKAAEARAYRTAPSPHVATNETPSRKITIVCPYPRVLLMHLPMSEEAMRRTSGANVFRFRRG